MKISHRHDPADEVAGYFGFANAQLVSTKNDGSQWERWAARVGVQPWPLRAAKADREDQ